MSATRHVVITGAGVVSPLGTTPAALHAALWEGKSGLRPVGLFATDGLSTRLGGEVAGFDPKDFLGNANYRPLDRTGRLATVATQLALDASGWSAELRAERELGLVLGTMFGSVHTISEFDRRAQIAGPIYAKPLDFANTVINAAAGQTAIWHDLRGINSTLAGGPSAGLQALAYAAELIRIGRADALLAGGADELCFESFHGYHQAGLLALPKSGEPERPVPFDARRGGFALAEGAALVVLEEAGAARARGARVLAEVLGHGNRFDPSRGTDTQSAVRAVAGAIRVALADAGQGPPALDAVSASASGSPRGDRHEAHGIAAALGEEARRLPIMAVKAHLGEALGASGAFQTVALLEAMRTGRLPGIRGLEELEPDFPLAGATAAGHQLELRRGLLVAQGLDGNVCALVLGHVAG